MDVHTPELRSYNMSRITSKNTKPEIAFRKLLWKAGLRNYRIHKNLPGSPDIVFVRFNLAIFVDGCFWHGCKKCYGNRKIKTNAYYWKQKIINNFERDKRQTKLLKKMGWKVLRFWDHNIVQDPAKCISKIKNQTTL
ncbi:DNA mismatch endonuclease Vsr [Candidatus Peregrinibacteria bacterium]|nr:DNA mismatch endonuclease Vsr [Candidatus Peregrinibacteria bacterium]